MPNYTHNSMIVEGPLEDLAKFREGMGEGDDIGLLEKFLPTSEYHRTHEGYNDGGYEWCIATWGTKWPEGDLEVFDDPTVAHMTFATAWSPPLAGIARISELFPTLVFSIDWQGDSNDFVGAAVYYNGEELALVDRDVYLPDDMVSKDGEADWDAINDYVSQERDECASEASFMSINKEAAR
jgi:hypothetical protein